LADTVSKIAEKAAIGLDIVGDGIGRIYGRTDLDLHRFANVALSHYRGTV